MPELPVSIKSFLLRFNFKGAFMLEVSKMLTSHDSDEEVELRHGVAEGGPDQSRPSQTTPDEDDWSTAIFVHKDAAEWTWRDEGAGEVILSMDTL